MQPSKERAAEADSTKDPEKKVIDDLDAVIADRRKAEERASNLLEAFDDQDQEENEEG